MLIYALIIVIAKPFKRLLELGEFGRKKPYVKNKAFPKHFKKKGFALRRSKEMVCNQERSQALQSLSEPPGTSLAGRCCSTVLGSPQSLRFFIRGSSIAS